jgi:hypothetical protein
MFHTFLEAMALVEFGDFDLIAKGFNITSFVDSPELAALNVSQLMLDVSGQKVECANSLVGLQKPNFVSPLIQFRAACYSLLWVTGAYGSVAVKALRYKPEGRVSYDGGILNCGT